MPIAGQTPLTTINAVKDLETGYEPLVLAQVTLVDGTILRYSTENLDSTDSGIQYNNFDWKPAIKNSDVGAIAAVSENGIVQSPRVQLVLADGNKAIWALNEYADGKGFKGAKLKLLLVYWDAGTHSFSSDSRVVFVGICDALTESTATTVTIVASNLLNMSRTFLPTVAISKFCPWTFPLTHADRVAAALDPFSASYQCGYSPDVTDSDGAGGTAAARGNYASGTTPFLFCNLDFESCIARMGNIGLPVSSNSISTPVRIEQDTTGRHTGRYGGVRWDPPATWGGRDYLSGAKTEGVNSPNDAKYSQYFPMIWGTCFVQPPILETLGDPNSTRFEVVLCVGQIHTDLTTPGPIQAVLVNDFYVPHISAATDVLLSWRWVSNGSRDGYTCRDAIFDGRGDPHGSQPCIEIVVPLKLASSSSIPNTRVLTTGPKIHNWNGPLVTNFTLSATQNSAHNLADILAWSNWHPTDLDLQTFADEATYANASVTYTNLTGSTATHARYKMGFALRDRRSSADVIKNVLAGFKAGLRPSLIDGTLQLVTRKTLADQQPAPVAGSNYNSAIASANAAGSAADGYVAYDFNESNIKWINNKPSLVISQRSIGDTPNKLSVPFQDEDYFFTSDSLTVVDSDDILRAGQEVSGSLAIEGACNVDQIKRAMESQLGEQYRGNNRSGAFYKNGIPINDSGGTYIAEFVTTARANHLRNFDIVRLSFTLFGISNQLFRVISITPSTDYEEMRIKVQWHEDDWYRDAYGQHPDPLLQAQRKHKLRRPPFGWAPNETAPAPGNSLNLPTSKTFALAQHYIAAADGTVLAYADLRGFLPVNQTSQKVSPPYAPQAEADTSAGSVPAGSYWLALAAVDAAGSFTAPSHPFAPAVLSAPGELTLPNIYWQSGSVGYRLYAGTNPNKLTLQASGGSTPGSLTMTSYKVQAEAMPDTMFDHMLFVTRFVWHSGTFGDVIRSMTATTIQIGGSPTLTVNCFAGSDLSILGQPNTSNDLGVWDFRIASNTADTFTLAAVGGVTPDLVAAGIKVGDVVVARAHGTISSANTIGDPNFINGVDYYDPPIPLAWVSGATFHTTYGSGIKIVTTVPAPYLVGDQLVFSGAGGVGGNGIKHTITTAYDTMNFLLDGSGPAISSGEYTGGGSVSMVTQGFRVNEEKGRIVRILYGTGRGQRRKILSNTTTVVTIVGVWDVIPDSTSVWIIEDETPIDQTASTSILNSDPTREIDTAINLNDYIEQMLGIQAFTVSADGTEALDTDSPFRELYMFGGPGTAVVQFYEVTFGVGIGAPAFVNSNVTPLKEIRRAGTALNVHAICKQAPTGADLIIDIKRTPVTGGGAASIFGSTKVVIPDGSTISTVLTVFVTSPVTFAEGDVLSCDINQVGSTFAGQDITVFLKVQTL